MKTALLLLLVPAFAFGQTSDTLVYNPRRAVQLAGASNFRDLGGYPTADGRTVKWGRIYRSADISGLTDADLQTLADRHIATVCDLRGSDEVSSKPDRLPAGATGYNLPAGSENVRAMTASLLSARPAGRDSLLRAFYGRTDHLRAKYRPLFDQLLALPDGQALLFHCTAGKDRTGIGAALVLSALGVDRSVILKDYAATDYYWQGGSKETVARMVANGADEKTVRAMLAADPAYLQITFDAIDRQYGSMNQFLTQVMGLTPETLAILRTKHLN